MKKYEVGNLVNVPVLGIVVKVVGEARVENDRTLYRVSDYFGRVSPEDDEFDVDADLMISHYLGAA